MPVDNTIQFDATELVTLCDRFTDPDNLHNLVAVTAEYAKAIWRRAASGRVYAPMDRPLYSDTYVTAISDPTNTVWSGPEQVTIDLTRFHGAASIENGYGPFDMKPKLLAAEKHRISADGLRYIDIPFRHGTPADPRDGPHPKRAQIQNTMPPAIYRIAKQLEIEMGERLDDSGGVALMKPKVGGMQNPYFHAGSVYDGMQKKRKNGQNSYISFRRISDKTPQEAFWHPGVIANPVIAGVVMEVERRLPEIVAAFISGLKAS